MATRSAAAHYKAAYDAALKDPVYLRKLARKTRGGNPRGAGHLPHRQFAVMPNVVDPRLLGPRQQAPRPPPPPPPSDDEDEPAGGPDAYQDEDEDDSENERGNGRDEDEDEEEEEEEDVVHGQGNLRWRPADQAPKKIKCPEDEPEEPVRSYCKRQGLQDTWKKTLYRKRNNQWETAVKETKNYHKIAKEEQRKIGYAEGYAAAQAAGAQTDGGVDENVVEETFWNGVFAGVLAMANEVQTIGDFVYDNPAVDQLLSDLDNNTPALYDLPAKNGVPFTGADVPTWLAKPLKWAIKQLENRYS